LLAFRIVCAKLGAEAADHTGAWWLGVLQLAAEFLDATGAFGDAGGSLGAGNDRGDGCPRRSGLTFNLIALFVDLLCIKADEDEEENAGEDGQPDEQAPGYAAVHAGRVVPRDSEPNRRFSIISTTFEKQD
jgi:hypothetical protein